MFNVQKPGTMKNQPKSNTEQSYFYSYKAPLIFGVPQNEYIASIQFNKNKEFIKMQKLLRKHDRK